MQLSLMRLTGQPEGDALESALRRVDNLYQVSHAIGIATTPEEVIDALLTQDEFQDATRVIVGVYEQPRAEEDRPTKWSILVDRPLDDETQLMYKGRTLPLSSVIYERSISGQSPIIIENVHTWPDISEEVRSFFTMTHTQSVVLFPLTAAQDHYGLLTFHFSQPISHQSEDLHYLSGVISQAAVSFRLQQLYASEAKARELAERADTLKLRLLAVISHELRTPLTSIKGFASTLLADDVEWDEDTQRDFMQTIEQEVDKLTELISQLLDLSRIEAGTPLSVERNRIHPEEVLDYAHASLKTLTHNHQLIIDVDPDLPFVKGDLSRLAQVLINLISNATRYSPNRSAIRLVLSASSGEVEFVVQDNGPGIALEQSEQIFEPFSRVSQHGQGLGLGLTISKGIIERHNGSIYVKHTGAQGTQIAFTLPAME